MRGFTFFYETRGGDGKFREEGRVDRATHVVIFAPGVDGYAYQQPNAIELRFEYPAQKTLFHNTLAALNRVQQFGGDLARTIVRDKLHDMLDLHLFHPEDED